MISAVLLAAGESRRMREFKQLLPLGEKTFVEHCVDNLLTSRVDEVLVVVGHRASEVRRVIANRHVRFLYNPDYRSGMASSIKCGVQALAEITQAFVIALVDQPQISTEAINLVIETYERSRPVIVIPSCEGRNGHPVLLDFSLREEILTMDSTQGLRQVIHAHSSEIVRVEVGDRKILEDCDLPEDYERMLNR